MSQQQDNNSMFGDDINSTPISKLQQIPMMTSKSDPGMAPVEPPVYNPTVEDQQRQQQKRVTFALEDDVYDEKEAKKKRRHRRRHHRDQQQQQWVPPVPQYYPQLAPPPVPPAPVHKTKKILEVMQVYGHRLVVFVMFMVVLWYYRKIASFPYVGGGNGYVSTMGSVGVALAASGVYGIVESLLD